MYRILLLDPPRRLGEIPDRSLQYVVVKVSVVFGWV